MILNSPGMQLLKSELLGIIAENLPEGAKTISAALFLDYKFALEVFSLFGILPAATDGCEVTTEPTFSAGKPKVLFEGPYVPTPRSFPDYDVSPDGR